MTPTELFVDDVFPSLHRLCLCSGLFFPGAPFPFPRALSSDFPLLIISVVVVVLWRQGRRPAAPPEEKGKGTQGVIMI